MIHPRFLQRLATWAALACLLVLATSCEEDDDGFDGRLRLLQQQVNGQEAVNGMDGVSKDVSIEIIFSHELNPNQIESGLSLTGGSGTPSYDLTYTNTNSTVTLEGSLDFETSYTLSLPAGTYGAGGQALADPFNFAFTTATPVLSLSVDNGSLVEDGGTATVTASLSGNANSEVSVQLSFGGSASEGADYTVSPSATLTIPAGQSQATATITAATDGVIEGTEEIQIGVDQVTAPFEFDGQEATVTVLDADIDSNGDGVADRGFIVNEILYDPASGEEGDANGDGTREAQEDEFIEFINDSDTEVDLSGFTVYDTDVLGTGSPRHTFPAGTVVPPGGVYVLFGGGAPSGGFGGAQTGVADPGPLNLNNGGDAITIFDASGEVFLSFDSETDGAGLDFGEDQSVTRSPDINGDYVLHTTANADLIFSPGTLLDGSAYPGNVGGGDGLGFIINEVLYDPASGEEGDANGDGTREAQEDEFIEFVNDSNQPFDLSGFTLYDNDQLGTEMPRHTFPAGTVVPPGGVYVLFGGGTPTGDFGGAQVAVANGFESLLNLNNSGDAITLYDASGEVFLTFDSETDGMGLSFGEDQSVTRSPDIQGDYVLHTTANSSLTFSPGLKSDGSSF